MTTPITAAEETIIVGRAEKLTILESGVLIKKTAILPLEHLDFYFETIKQASFFNNQSELSQRWKGGTIDRE